MAGWCMSAGLVAVTALALPVAIVACGSRTGLDVPLVVVREGPDGAVSIVQDASVSREADAPTKTPPGLDCAEAGITYIYVIAEDNTLFSFYPTTAAFTPVGKLMCPIPLGSATEPFSMAVDHTGTAYVVFSDPTAQPSPTILGEGDLYRVSTKTGACVSTPFVADQQGFLTFGMGFVANVGDGGTGETLYIAGDTTDSLASVDLQDFTVNPVAPFGAAGPGLSVAAAELTGTGDGRLFGFFAPDNTVPVSYIVQIDPKTASILSTVELPGVEEGQGWAFGFWGGDFYTFTAPPPPSAFEPTTTVVTRYRPSDGSIVQVATAPSGVVIVGAGVSTCAPQQ